MPPDREHPSLPPPSCGNPEYYEILKKVAAEAQRGHNVNWIRALRRAMDSLSRYPLSFTQPKQAQQLANIGPAIVSVLERCIKEAGGHIEEDEADAPESQGAQEDGVINPERQPRTKEKSYIPRRRSGGYALLIALHRLTERHGEGVGKIELIHEAAPLSQNSFTSPLPGSRYTAWSSMKTLREHELIHSYGRPVRYRLTERGQSLAQRLATTLAEEEGTSRVEKEAIRPVGTSIPQTSIPPPLDNASPIPASPTPSTSAPVRARGTFQYTYLDAQGNPVQRKDQAHLQLYPDEDVPYCLIAYSSRQQGHSLCRLVRPLVEGGSTIQLPSKPSTRLAFQEVAYGMLPMDVGDRVSPTSPLSKALGAEVASTALEYISSSTGMEVIDLCQEPRLSQASNNLQPERTLQDNPTGVHLQTPNLPTLSPLRQVHFPPKSFKVALAVDVRELLGRGSSGARSKTVIMDRLRESQIPIISRALPIGDFLWMAVGPMGQEIVLDWIIERKTMDDLVCSIKDGRFQEQKSRLRQSGAQRVIYLIEGFSRSFPGLCPRVTLETVQSALSRLVLHHGFTIHHTTSLEGSISYLTSLTRRMMARYEGKDIMGMDEVTRTFTALSDTPFPTNPLLTYQAFQAMTEKSTGRTVKEMWLRMLVSIHGVGVDKALSISRRFPTPMSLECEYRQQDSMKNAQDLLVCTNEALPRRKIHPKLSAQIHGIWHHRSEDEHVSRRST